MPYLINPTRHTTDEIQWADVWTVEQQGPNYARLGSSHGQEPAIKGPIPYRMYKGSQGRNGVLPDILPGRWSADMIVSQKIREMIEGMDNITHHFIPLELTLKDGAQVRDRFLFVAGDRIDGIIAEESEVSPQFFGGKLGFYFAPTSPKIVWRADAIAGRAIWVDRYLPNNIVICDELEEAFQKASIKHYRKTVSPVQI